MPKKNMLKYRRQREFLKWFLKDIFIPIVKDILIPIVFGICSVCVARAANDIAKSANETAELQALIAKNAEAPTMEIVHSLGDSERESSISISILDGKYSNFESDTVSFLSFDFYEYDENGLCTINRADLPISYYNTLYSQEAMYGEIREWQSDSGLETEPYFDKCEEYYTEKCIDSGTEEESQLGISVTTCLKCSYLNLLEEEENVYYLVGSAGKAFQITKEMGSEWFQKYENMQEDSFSFDEYWIRNDNVAAAFELIDRINADGKQYLVKDPFD